MSGININTSANYQQQLDQLGASVANIEAELKKLENDNESVVSAYNKAKDKIAETLVWAKSLGFTDAQGKPLQFNTLQEFHDLCLKGGVYRPDGSAINEGKPFWFVDTLKYLEAFKAAEAAFNSLMGPTLAKLKEAQAKLSIIGAGLNENIESLNAMAKLLESGDIEGAVMLLQTSRAKTLEKQLATRVEGMQARNAMIRSKNDDMALKQNEQAGLTGDNNKTAYANKQAEITKIKGEIDQLNTDSSLDMIGIQTLVNKRNEAFDTLTNLLGKFQKTVDGIVSNLR